MNSNNCILQQLLFYEESDISDIKAIIQGQYIRDNKLNDILFILQTKLFYKFNFKEFDIITDIKGNVYYDTQQDCDKFINLDIEDINTDILVSNILDIDQKSDKLTFFYAGVPSHVTGHYIIGNNVWIYEPYCYNYNYMNAFRNEYIKNGFIINKLPDFILKQKELDLCYIYVLHFFIVKLLEINNYTYDYKNISNINSDKYISKLTYNLIEFLYRYKYISSWNYYLLKDDINGMTNFISDKKTIYINVIDQLCNIINSKEMLLCIIDKIRFSKINNKLHTIMNKYVYNYEVFNKKLYEFMINIFEIIIKKKNYTKLLTFLIHNYINILLDMNIDFGNIKDTNMIWDIYFNSIIQKNMIVYEKSMLYNYHTILIYSYDKEFFDYLYWYVIEYDDEMIMSILQLMNLYIVDSHKIMFLDTVKKIEKQKNICVL